MYFLKNGKRVRCIHRYKGLHGIYPVWRDKKTRDGYILTQYQCQIKGCNHWETRFKNKL